MQGNCSILNAYHSVWFWYCKDVWGEETEMWIYPVIFIWWVIEGQTFPKVLIFEEKNNQKSINLVIEEADERKEQCIW